MRKTKGMIKQFALSLSLACVLTSPLFGHYAPLPLNATAREVFPLPECCTPFLGNQLRVEIDFLYWKPYASDLDFAVLSKTIHEGINTHRPFSYQAIGPSWSPGICLQIDTPSLPDDWEIGGGYTYIESATSKRVPSLLTDVHDGIFSPLIQPSLSYPWGRIEGSYSLIYQSADVSIGRSLHFSNQFTFKPFFAFTGLFINQTLKTHLTQPKGEALDFECNEGRTKWRSGYWAYGFKCGTEYQYTLCQHFQLYGRAEAMLVGGWANTVNTFRLSQGFDEAITSYKWRDPNALAMSPGFHLALGVTYTFTCLQQHMAIKIGYECIEWFWLPGQRRFFGDSREDMHQAFLPNLGAVTSARQRTIGFQGLLTGLKIDF